MTRSEAERLVADLLAERAKLARLHLDMPPAKRLLLERLQFRLGWKTGATPMARLPRRVLKYAEVGGNYETHNQLIAAIRANPDEATPRLQLADFLQENGIPGAHVVRAHAQGMLGGTRTSRARPSESQPDLTGYEEWDSSPVYAFTSAGRRDLGPGGEWADLGDEPATHLQLFHFGSTRQKRGVVVGVNHRQGGHVSDGVTHSAHAATPQQLRDLLSDFPPEQVADILRRYLRRYLPRTRAPARPKNSPGGAVDQAAAAVHPRLSRKYAKADKTRAKAHPLVEGFPISHALRHLANDPANSDTLRQTALVALTGRNGDAISPEGNPEALWALHDLLQDPDHNASGRPHPLATAYNWMSAADKIVLDAHTRRALEEHAQDRRRVTPGPHHVGGNPNEFQWVYTPEQSAQTAGQGLLGDKQASPPNIRAQRVAVLNRIRARVKQLSPHTPDEHIDESIRRHAHRANMVWRREHGIPTDADERRALEPVGKGTDPNSMAGDYHENERATRYRRNSVKLKELPRRYAMNDVPGLLHASRRAEVPRRNHAPATLAHDTTAGGALADNLDENDLPHAPFFRRLVPSITQTGPEGGAEFHTPDGTWRNSYAWRANRMRVTVVPTPHAAAGEPEWVFRPVSHAADPNRYAVLVHRRDPGGATHSAVLHAADLRQWGAHPVVEHGLRNQIDSAVRDLAVLNARPPAPEQLRRDPKKYAQERTDFIDALRRARSSQMTALKRAAQSVAARLGFAGASAVASLHDGPQGATPGLSQSLYGGGSPEQVHALAAWQALMGGMPGVAVFHSRPVGPDRLYQLKFKGSGLALRQKLDRAGIGQRVLVPHRSGYDCLIPDAGGRLARTVSAFAEQNRTPLQVSRGYLKTVGDRDKANARSQFRGTISGAERRQMRRNYGRTRTTVGELFHRIGRGDDSAIVPLADALREAGREDEADWLTGNDTNDHVVVVPSHGFVSRFAPQREFREGVVRTAVLPPQGAGVYHKYVTEPFDWGAPVGDQDAAWEEWKGANDFRVGKVLGVPDRLTVHVVRLPKYRLKKTSALDRSWRSGEAAPQNPINNGIPGH